MTVARTRKREDCGREQILKITIMNKCAFKELRKFTTYAL